MKKIEDVTGSRRAIASHLAAHLGTALLDKRAVRPPWPTLFDEWRGRWPSPNPIRVGWPIRGLLMGQGFLPGGRILAGARHFPGA